MLKTLNLASSRSGIDREIVLDFRHIAKHLPETTSTAVAEARADLLTFSTMKPQWRVAQSHYRGRSLQELFEDTGVTVCSLLIQLVTELA